MFIKTLKGLTDAQLHSCDLLNGIAAKALFYWNQDTNDDHNRTTVKPAGKASRCVWLSENKAINIPRRQCHVIMATENSYVQITL